MSFRDVIWRCVPTRLPQFDRAEIVDAVMEAHEVEIQTLKAQLTQIKEHDSLLAQRMDEMILEAAGNIGEIWNLKIKLSVTQEKLDIAVKALEKITANGTNQSDHFYIALEALKKIQEGE